ncbi:MAG: bifunctional nuclease domain-containing protein [Bacteroidota bacterium]
MEKIKLNVLGISYSQTQAGAYALVLNEEKGERRIPIIIGGFEAQSIAIQLEGLNSPRPLTHDLFFSFANAFSINLQEVIIYKLEEGVFHSKLICNNGKKNLTIDSRTSDAVALALRFNASIYTTEEILQKAGIVLDIEHEDKSKEPKSSTQKAQKKPAAGGTEKTQKLSNEELQKMLQKAISKEEYEEASRIRDEINRRKEKPKD